MAQFGLGDVIRLKSGGPLMTVSALLRADNQIGAIWFSAHEEVKGASFEPELVEKVTVKHYLEP